MVLYKIGVPLAPSMILNDAELNGINCQQILRFGVGLFAVASAGAVCVLAAALMGMITSLSMAGIGGVAAFGLVAGCLSYGLFKMMPAIKDGNSPPRHPERIEICLG